MIKIILTCMAAALVAAAGCEKSHSRWVTNEVCCECLAETLVETSGYEVVYDGGTSVGGSTYAPCLGDLGSCMEKAQGGQTVKAYPICILSNDLCGRECQTWEVVE